MVLSERWSLRPTFLFDCPSHTRRMICRARSVNAVDGLPGVSCGPRLLLFGLRLADMGSSPSWVPVSPLFISRGIAGGGSRALRLGTGGAEDVATSDPQSEGRPGPSG